MLNTYDINSMMDKYPRARGKLFKWLEVQADKIRKNLLKEAGKEGEPLVPLEESDLAGIANTNLMYNPRNLYEFFDENDLNIEIYCYKGGFTTQIGNLWTNDNASPTRFEAERIAFDRAFYLLEQR